MKMKFKSVYTCWVAEHPNPIGTIEFLGGTFFGIFPTIFYSYFLDYLYGKGYSIVTSPFRLSLNHTKIAREIYGDRQRVFSTLDPCHKDLPRIWVGHSLGCKYILILEMAGEADGESFPIKDQPSILIAPNISNTLKAVRSKLLADFLDRFGCGVNPKREDLKASLAQSRRFNLSAIISFGCDTEAGTQDESSEEPDFSDVALITKTLSSRSERLLLTQELAKSNHLEPIKIGIQEQSKPPRKLEIQVFDYLNRMIERI